MKPVYVAESHNPVDSVEEEVNFLDSTRHIQAKYTASCLAGLSSTTSPFYRIGLSHYVDYHAILKGSSNSFSLKAKIHGLSKVTEIRDLSTPIPLYSKHIFKEVQVTGVLSCSLHSFSSREMVFDSELNVSFASIMMTGRDLQEINTTKDKTDTRGRQVTGDTQELTMAKSPFSSNHTLWPPNLLVACSGNVCICCIMVQHSIIMPYNSKLVEGQNKVS
ncbi:hypothetical protein J437_LFUL012567 [Ladona fulva]|uniref:Uncharacterized protein n=1 Tax=Ladona fulva TaxID=123851 RepID=A0A8K0P6Y3_LADFU|nr:hypothetical protein J437_LFUL012567 [Ladona fulva]